MDYSAFLFEIEYRIREDVRQEVMDKRASVVEARIEFRQAELARYLYGLFKEAREMDKEI